MIYAGVLVLFLFFAFLLQDFVVSLGGAFLALCGARRARKGKLVAGMKAQRLAAA